MSYLPMVGYGYFFTFTELGMAPRFSQYVNAPSHPRNILVRDVFRRDAFPSCITGPVSAEAYLLLDKNVEAACLSSV